MRTDADFKKRMNTHKLGVEIVRTELENYFTYLPARPVGGLPEMTFTTSVVGRISEHQMPRDFLLRTLGGEIEVKVLHVPGKASSSLYRVAAYMLMAGPRYLQIVSGTPAADVHRQLWWLDKYQSEVQITEPTGVRALADITDVAAHIRGWQGICDE
jgi:hypothetical protein